MQTADDEALPEGLSEQEVHALLDQFLSEEASDTPEQRRRKADVLGDKQWHTYTEPAAPTRELLQGWVEQQLLSPLPDLEMLLGLCYTFALPKSLFLRLLTSYDGEFREEYQAMLAQSAGALIEPYASLRKVLG